MADEKYYFTCFLSMFYFISNKMVCNINQTDGNYYSA